MEADGQLVAFLDAVASQTAAESGGTAPGGAGPLSPAQLAEATAPVLFSPSAQVRQRSTLPALVLAAVTLAPEGLVAQYVLCVASMSVSCETSNVPLPPWRADCNIRWRTRRATS